MFRITADGAIRWQRTDRTIREPRKVRRLRSALAVAARIAG